MYHVNDVIRSNTQRHKSKTTKWTIRYLETILIQNPSKPKHLQLAIQAHSGQAKKLELRMAEA